MFRRSARLRMVFQFLIVQLKADNGQYFAPPSSIVSIPYSTIKSIEDGKFKVEHILVSIPYSTIKRIVVSKRLFTASVSIPYSTIKSTVSKLTNPSDICFNSL